MLIEEDLTLDGVTPSVVDDLRRAETPSAPVVVDGAGPEVAELAEQLADVGLRHAEVEVGDDQLPRAGVGRQASDGPSGEAVVLPCAVHGASLSAWFGQILTLLFPAFVATF